jgi:hypothetical protein
LFSELPYYIALHYVYFAQEKKGIRD